MNKRSIKPFDNNSTTNRKNSKRYLEFPAKALLFHSALDFSFEPMINTEFQKRKCYVNKSHKGVDEMEKKKKERI